MISIKFDKIEAIDWISWKKKIDFDLVVVVVVIFFGNLDVNKQTNKQIRDTVSKSYRETLNTLKINVTNFFFFEI